VKLVESSGTVSLIDEIYCAFNPTKLKILYERTLLNVTLASFTDSSHAIVESQTC